MIQYVLRRLLILPLIMFLVTLILFSLMWQLPVELRTQVYVPYTNKFLSPEEEAAPVKRAIRIHGVDEPWPVQYPNWLRLLVIGDWGYSPVWQQPVLEGLLQRAPATAGLVLTAVVPRGILGLGLTLEQGKKARQPLLALGGSGWLGRSD